MSVQINTTREYMDLCIRTWNYQSMQRDALHAVLGVSSEIGELLSCYKKHIGYGKEVDTANVLEECGDAFYFLLRLADIFELQLPCEIIDLKGSESIRTLDEAISEALRLQKIFPAVESFSEDDTLAFYRDQSIFKTCVVLNEILCFHGFTVKQAMVTNIEKLKVRFPAKFDSELVLNRDLDAEYQTLKDNATKNN